MRLLLIAAVPIALLGAWTAVRAILGRPVKRFTLNAIVGVMLLVYFGITAGLGIFWVANQELPVFDPHYLFGYLTLLLVAVHVAINTPLLLRFVRRLPGASADGRVFRPTLRWAGRLLLVGAYGGCCYWLGFSRGSTHVTVTRGEQDQLVSGQPLWRWYHARSSMSRRVAVARGPALDWATRPEPFETYPSEAVVRLPDEHLAVDLPTGDALAGGAAEALGAAEISIAQLGTLLHLMQGITEVDGDFFKRAAASSGALYPTVTHVVVGDIDGLAPGLYHYEPASHALHRLRGGDVRAELVAAIAHPHAAQAAPFAIVLSAIYAKTAWKYEERAYRYVLLDAGHVAANAIAAGHALGLATRAIGRFDDARLGALLGVDADRQGPVLVLPFGAATEAHGPEPVFAPADLALADDAVPASVLLMASRTALARTGATSPEIALVAAQAPEARAGDPLRPVIERRRSTRRFSDASIPRADLDAILRRAAGPSVEGQGALRVHVFAFRVDGLAPGAYEATAGGLREIRAGDLSSEVHGAALSQEVAERAAAVLVMSADVATLTWPDGSRGYRYAWLDAGIAGGRINLHAVALGLGVSSIGAFFDDDLTELLRLDGVHPALLVAIGAPG